MVEEMHTPQGEELTFGVIYDPHFSDAAPRSRKDDYVQALFDKMVHVGDDLKKAGGRFLIFTGDICNKYALTTKYMCKLVEALKSFPVPIYGIAGNHDVYAGNVDFINRTSLGILFSSGVIRPLEHLLVNLPKFSVHVRGFDYRPALHVKTSAMEDLLVAYEEQHRLEGELWDGLEVKWHLAVAHGFVRKSHANFETKDYVNVPSFGDAGYRALFLGHDHVPYPVEERDGLLLCRGGSLSRGTKHNYQRERDVQYHLVTVSQEGIDIEGRKIPCAPAEEIYSEQQIEREDLSLQLKHFVKKLQEEKQQADGEDDIFSIIEGMPAAQHIKDICYRYLQEEGIVKQS